MGDWINSQVVFLLFGERSRSCRMQLRATCIKDGCLKKNNRMLHSANQEYEYCYSTLWIWLDPFYKAKGSKQQYYLGQLQTLMVVFVMLIRAVHLSINKI